MKQRSRQWFLERLGKVTASNIFRIMGSGKLYQTYKSDIVCEQFLKICDPENAFELLMACRQTPNANMQWGIDNEDMARSAYSIATNAYITQCGLILHPTIPNAGASPDGLVGDHGLVEIKCPTTATHMRFIVDQTIDPKYYTQMQFQMACTQRQWCDFVSYDPRLQIENLSMQIVRVERDDAHIAEIEQQAKMFLEDVRTTLKNVFERNNMPFTSNEL